MKILKSNNFVRTIGFITVALLISVCGRQVLNPLALERVILENDKEILNKRVKYFNEKVRLDSLSSLSETAIGGTHSHEINSFGRGGSA